MWRWYKMDAPKSIPDNMYNDYIMNGKANIEYKYGNDCSQEIQDMINENFTKEVFDESAKRIQAREQNYYGPTDTWLYQAFEKYPISDLNVCIVGSTHPWYETMAMTYGAQKVTVVEYSERKSFHPKIKYIQPHEVGDQKFDACLSISSFEHDGLGRYGDPLNPIGDLEAMKNLKSNVKKNGILFLSVPAGFDKVVFNVHRVYGKHRFPLLIEGWELKDIFGQRPDMFQNNFNGIHGSPYQPVFVLGNK